VDFGLAKVQLDDPMRSSGTRTGTILGTPYYMSPEQGRGLKTVDHRTDLWSLGVIAFECVTGRVPFEADSLTDLLVQASTSPIPRPSTGDSKIPASFDAWLTRALDRDPNGRFASATELADALEHVAAASAVTQSIGTAATQPRLAFTRPRALGRWAPLAGVAALVVVGAYGVTRYAHPHHDRAPRSTSPTQTLTSPVTSPGEEVAPLPTLEPLAPLAPAVSEAASSVGAAHPIARAQAPAPKPHPSGDFGAGF
jgi:serine/threonine protein kinase